MYSSQELHELCLKYNITLAVAESCTSGILASALSSFPGSSNYFKGGVIAYQDQIKINILDVSENIIHNYGAVSSEVVSLMANNILSIFNSDFSVATSGFAGPGGGTKEYPVGTVFIAINNNENSLTRKFIFKGNRKQIIEKTVRHTLLLLLSEIKKYK